jgi:hypothetical protein
MAVGLRGIRGKVCFIKLQIGKPRKSFREALFFRPADQAGGYARVAYGRRIIYGRKVRSVEKKNLGGRPRKFNDLAEFRAAIDAYFEGCYADVIIKDKDGNAVLDEEGRPIKERMQVEPFTITGLALALDTSREVLMDIETQTSEGYSQEFSDAVKRAKLRCQQYAERHMFTARNPAGAIFALKNYGWTDRQDLAVDASVRVTYEDILSELDD